MSTPSAVEPPYRFYDSRLLPARAPAGRSRWLIRIVLWLAVAVLLVFALRFDVALMRWRYDVLPDGPRGFAKEAVVSFRDFGQQIPIVVGCIIIAVLDRRRRTIVPAILVAQLLAMGVYDLTKFTVVRDRPQCAIESAMSDPQNGADRPIDAQQVLAAMQLGDTWRGLSAYNRDSRHQSFPSGHSSASFAFAGVLAWFYPPLALLWWILAVGCAASRYVDAVHWLSDCIAGASIGYAAAWLALRPWAWSRAWAREK